MNISLLLCDDHVLFSDALASVLGTEFHVLGVIDKMADIPAAIRQHRPDVCLLDRRFVDGDALDRLTEIRAARPATKVVVLTADQDDDGLHRALAGGAAGYVQKTCGVATLTAALRSVVAGEVVVHVASERSALRSRGSAEAVRLAAHLTARERECLAMLVEGLSTSEMVARLGVATTTVRTHIQALLSKLGVHSRLEAASLAVRYSLLDEQHPRRRRRRQLDAEAG
ncbi:response regulator transcription factor [Amycolatopsis sp. 195334CR]|uniref:response regulator n=1 Tax=Amycolatopsis sp. 195334CR TaxID=2814588 RepID=UPI001A8E3A65|nr:response regulator transcription factor [Amycolatopsis sp. 195334CR]MBN6033587.1 response regulator transcription factor [Amycolatopsis sp. 195334CR]